MRILCFGDSNTYGWNPGGYRNRFEDRWPNVLGACLGNVRIIEEGLGGRVFCHDNPNWVGRNGLTYLFPCIQTHQDFDLICIMLGTNDVNTAYHETVQDIANEARTMLRLIMTPEIYDTRKCPKVLLIAPLALNDECTSPFFTEGFGTRAVEITRQLPDALKQVADEYGAYFFDASAVVKGSITDGIHLLEADHHTLGEALAEPVRAILEL